MSKVTAVEWLVEQLKERGYAGEFPPHLLFDQAKEMEKEQHQKTAIHFFPTSLKKEDFEQYYKETYGN
jgi:hypothetical protein